MKKKKIFLLLIISIALFFVYTDSVNAAFTPEFAASSFTCNYKGQKNGGTLSITKNTVNVDTGVAGNIAVPGGGMQVTVWAWDVKYPDNSDRHFTLVSTENNIFPTNNCEDIFYSEKNGHFFSVDRASFYYIQTMNQYCSSFDDLEQFCQNGNCKINNAPCGNKANETDWGSCPAELIGVVKFLKIVVFNTLQIAVPIILIIIGSIDLSRAVFAGDDKGIKDATSKLIKKFIMAIIFFFVTTIVTFVLNGLAKADIEGFEDWKACWFYNDGGDE